VGRRTTPNWTDNEIQKLRTMIAAGALATDIAQALGRSTNAVVTTARKLSLSVVSGPKKEIWRCAYCHRQPPRVRRINSGAHVCRRCRDDLAARGLRWCCGCRAPKSLHDVVDRHGRCGTCMTARTREPSVREGGTRWRKKNHERVTAYQRDFVARRKAADPDYEHRMYMRKKAKVFHQIWSGARPHTDDVV